MLRDHLEQLANFYQRKLDVAANRLRARRVNRKFELDRGRFYRELDQPKMVSPDLSASSAAAYWSGVWTNRIDTVDHSCLVQQLPPAIMSIDLSRERLADIVRQKIAHLPNWKAAGPDRVFNFFIKKLTSLHQCLIVQVVDAVLS